MRLVKINDIILNMDRILVVKGRPRSKDYGGGFTVYAYLNGSNYVELGVCENEDDYKKFMAILYSQLQETFSNEVVPRDNENSMSEEDLEELWG